ncbi:hypothetical protein [Streptomyces sp. NPDC055189]
MAPTEHTPDIVQTQRDWNRTYAALAGAPAISNTALRRRLIGLSRHLFHEVPRAQLADLRRRAEDRS